MGLDICLQSVDSCLTLTIWLSFLTVATSLKHIYAAQKAQVDQILTFNKRDFERIYPNLISKIIIP